MTNASYLLFNAPITDATNATFQTWAVSQINLGARELVVSFTTTGGSVMAGVSMANFLPSLPVPVVLHNTANVGSIGIMIYAKATIRRAEPMSSFVFHGAGITTPNRMDQKALSEFLETVSGQNRMIASVVQSRSNISADAVGLLISGENSKPASWAHANGLVDSIEHFSIPPGANVMTLFEQQ